MSQSVLLKYRRDFDEYFSSKSISATISKKFLSSFNQHIDENPRSFSNFWRFIISVRHLRLEESIQKLNSILIKKGKGFKTFTFIIEWSHSYLGPGEIMFLLISSDSYSGGKKYPDILFRDSNKRIEIKSYIDSFRLTEATSFFTDLGTIVQALVQGGFLNSLTDINNNDLKRGLKHFCQAFLCHRGFIELNSKIWKLEYSDEEKMVFKVSQETPRDIVMYSIVRNSLRNWLGRGMLSIKLANIIDPTRTTRIIKNEVKEYIDSLMGYGDLIPIALDQYFSLCGLESIVIYERKNKKEPFKIYNREELKYFSLYRIGQSKVSYKKIK